MRLLPLCIMFGVAVSAGVQEWSCAPRMRRQPILRSYERRLPDTPEHSVPRDGAPRVPSGEEAAVLPNPVASSPEALARGKLYYGYYCQTCHGEDGRGHTPVGESYHPAPGDLSDAALHARLRSDGALYCAMVVGVGHEATLAYIVPSERRWPTVHHVRTLAPPPQ